MIVYVPVWAKVAVSTLVPENSQPPTSCVPSGLSTFIVAIAGDIEFE
jgi:hypothetical protein